MTPEEIKSLDNYIELMEMTIRAHTARLKELNIRLKYLKYFKKIDWIEKVWLESKYEAINKQSEIHHIEQSLAKAYTEKMALPTVFWQPKGGVA